MIYEDTKLLKIFHPYFDRGGAFLELTGMFVKIFYQLSISISQHSYFLEPALGRISFFPDLN